jgi:hypothetical protein
MKIILKVEDSEIEKQVEKMIQFTASYHRTVAMAKRIINSANQANITTDADSSVSINQNYAINVGQSVRLQKLIYHSLMVQVWQKLQNFNVSDPF